MTCLTVRTFHFYFKIYRLFISMQKELLCITKDAAKRMIMKKEF